MPSENSSFTYRELADILSSKYLITPLSIGEISTGTANCFRISSEKGEYFLKEYQSGFGEANLRRESELLNFLTGESFPTVGFTATAAGELYISEKGKYLSLQPFVGGTAYCDNDLPDPCLIESAGLLGRLHSILKDYPLPLGMSGDWIDSFCPASAAAKYDSLLCAAESLSDTAARRRIIEDLSFKKELLAKIAPYGEYYRRLTYTPTHGDFSARQLICDGGKIRAVIDFSAAATIPAAWELMRCYTQSAADCRAGTGLDTDKICRFVSEYLGHSKLNDYDIGYMPHIYLYQLGRSAFGYKEYLSNKNRDGEALLRFAFWRTDICRMLLGRVDEIGFELFERVKK